MSMMIAFCGGYNFCVIVFISVIISDWFSRAHAQKELNLGHNAYCLPRPTLVATDYPYFRYFPYYVILHRCNGSGDTFSPRDRTCVSNRTEDVIIQAHITQNGQKVVVKEKNHTSCKTACVLTKDKCDPTLEYFEETECSCKCRYRDRPQDAPCKPRFRFDEFRCKCECDVENTNKECQRVNKELDVEKCSCSCSERSIQRCKRRKMLLDKKTCQCVRGELITGARNSEDCISKVVLFGIVIGELVLLLLVLDLCLFKKDSGLIFFLFCSKRDKPNPKANHDKTTQL